MVRSGRGTDSLARTPAEWTDVHVGCCVVSGVRPTPHLTVRPFAGHIKNFALARHVPGSMEPLRANRALASRARCRRYSTLAENSIRKRTLPPISTWCRTSGTMMALAPTAIVVARWIGAPTR